MREWMQSGALRIGTVVTISNPTLAEIVKMAGFDWIWIDGEHGSFDCESASVYCAINAGGPKTFVRLPDRSSTNIKRFLDIGADGIILPQVSSREEVLEIGRHALYPPRGERSIGISRAQGFGTSLTQSLRQQSYAILVQIETVAGVENIEDILASDVVDGVLIGPYDLSGSYGSPGAIELPEVQSAIGRVLQASQRVGKPCGIFAATIEAGRTYAAQGFRMVAIGMDSTLILNTLKSLRYGMA